MGTNPMAPLVPNSWRRRWVDGGLLDESANETDQSKTVPAKCPRQRVYEKIWLLCNRQRQPFEEQRAIVLLL